MSPVDPSPHIYRLRSTPCALLKLQKARKPIELLKESAGARGSYRIQGEAQRVKVRIIGGYEVVNEEHLFPKTSVQVRVHSPLCHN